MGKTTLARVVFNRICDRFDATSFLRNVREVSKGTRGLETLQELVSDMKLKSKSDFWDVYKGTQVTSSRLRNKRVLIVVDDATEERQLETLVGKHDWFGLGSRIIVTTQDTHLLASCEVQAVCMAKGLNNVEALQLFCQRAFRKPNCENDFLDLCNKFVNYAQGLPLALEVLGSFLCERRKEEWESALNQLKGIPDENILEMLLAFDGLKC